jgi:hypothetical protein
MRTEPTSSVAVGAGLEPAQRIGDLDVFFTERGLRIVREPAPWSNTLKLAVVVGVAAGTTGAIVTEHRVGALIGFPAGFLGVVLVMRRRILIEVRGGVLLWQDTGRFFGRGLHNVALHAIDVIRVGPRPSLLLEERDGRSIGLLHGMQPALLKQVGALLEGHLDRRRR